ncbi:unnamed protein product [Amoebophrya sp. A25]|nr:unnamed protein product [Amoebophrya sp. A25]|eukprot:GSA25T00014605001.1
MALKNNTNTSKTIARIRQAVSVLLAKRQTLGVVIHWAPSHRGIRINVLADILGDFTPERMPPTDMPCLTKRRIAFLCRTDRERRNAADGPNALPAADDTTLRRTYRTRRLGRPPLAGLTPGQERVVFSIWSGENFLPADALCPMARAGGLPPRCARCSASVPIRRASGGSVLAGAYSGGDMCCQLVDHLIAGCRVAPEHVAFAMADPVELVAKDPKRHTDRVLATLGLPSTPPSWPKKKKEPKPSKAEEEKNTPPEWKASAGKAVRTRQEMGGAWGTNSSEPSGNLLGAIGLLEGQGGSPG